MKFKTKLEAENYIAERKKSHPTLIVVEFEKINGYWKIGFNVYN